MDQGITYPKGIKIGVDSAALLSLSSGKFAIFAIFVLTRKVVSQEIFSNNEPIGAKFYMMVYN